MPAVPEDVVTDDLTTAPDVEATSMLVAEVTPPAAPAATNGVAPAGQPEVTTPPAPQPAREEMSMDQAMSQPMYQSDFESMFKELSEGDVVVGTVVHIDKDGVLVDVGSKSEGVIRPNELSREPLTTSKMLSKWMTRSKWL